MSSLVQFKLDQNRDGASNGPPSVINAKQRNFMKTKNEKRNIPTYMYFTYTIYISERCKRKSVRDTIIESKEPQ